MSVVKINAEKIIRRDVNEQTEREDSGPPQFRPDDCQTCSIIREIAAKDFIILTNQPISFSFNL